MLTFHHTLPITLPYPIYVPDQEEDILFFDIETTGLSSKNSIVYLIGIIYYKEQHWNLTQLLANTIPSEVNLIQEFLEYAKNYKRIIHYNGTSFDLPFLMERCKIHGIEHSLLTIESYDIYQALRGIKHLLPVTDLKLKTLENYMNYHRVDKYSGNELIQIYAQYLGRLQADKLHQKTQTINDCPADTSSALVFQDVLLLHNKEDLLGLIQITPLLYLCQWMMPHKHTTNTNNPYYLLNSNTTPYLNEIEIHTEEKNNCYCILLVLPFSLQISEEYWCPVVQDTRIEYSKDISSLDHIVLTIHNTKLNLRIPIYQGELKHFYNNPKDYYYLPTEDMAIHKSIAQYVDKEFKTKAKASNCYIKLHSNFIFQPEDIYHPCFSFDHKQIVKFFELSNIEFRNTTDFYPLGRSMLYYILSNKNTIIKSNNK